MVPVKLTSQPLSPPKTTALAGALNATNGKTIKGTWKKTSTTGPTRFYDADGKRVTLTIGQTFIQVMPSLEVA